jgi:flagellar hook-associated protein 1 FlgK
MTLTSALRIATSGMQFSQAGLGNVSHNIVNANTAGYTRQVVQSNAVAYNGFGAGVQMSTIQRITDDFLAARTLSAGADLSYASTRRTFLDSVEGAMNGTNAEGSLQDLSNTFFDALSQLANSPADSSLRRNAVQTAVLFADTLRGVNADIDTVQTRVDNQLSSELESVNEVLKRIYDLNKEIALVGAGSVNGGNTNDLQDSRDAQVAELSKRFKVNVTTSQNGSLRILTETGRRLVDESSYVQLKRVAGSGDFSDIVAQNVQVDGTLNPALVPIDTQGLTSGSIKSLIDLRDNDIPDLLAELDEFASTLMAEFNKVYSRGTTVPPQATLDSYATTGLASITADMFANLDSSLASDSFHISIVDSQGDVISTTVGNGGPVTLPGAGPFSLSDLATLINNNVDLGNTELSTTDTAPAVLGVSAITTDGTLANGTYTIRRIDATTVELWNAANTAQIAGTASVVIVQPAVGPQTLNFGQGLTVTTDNTLDISGTADGAAAGTITLGSTAGVTATATTNGAGQPIIRIQTATPGQYVVLSNVTGDALGILGMQQFFTGTDSDDINIAEALRNNPELLAVGRMRTSDGGLSSLNNENALAISQLADTRLGFSAAGALGALNVTSGGYLGSITSNLAIVMADANSRESFADTVNNQVTELKGGISGVNVNEELSQMLVYQNSFQASARIITVVNQLLDALVSIIR